MIACMDDDTLDWRVSISCSRTRDEDWDRAVFIGGGYDVGVQAVSQPYHPGNPHSMDPHHIIKQKLSSKSASLQLPVRLFAAAASATV